MIFRRYFLQGYDGKKYHIIKKKKSVSMFKVGKTVYELTSYCGRKMTGAYMYDIGEINSKQICKTCLRISRPPAV